MSFPGGEADNSTGEIKKSCNTRLQPFVVSVQATGLYMIPSPFFFFLP
jgi:hypothetical protein